MGFMIDANVAASGAWLGLATAGTFGCCTMPWSSATVAPRGSEILYVTRI